MKTKEFLESIGFQHDQDYYLNVATVEEWQKWFLSSGELVEHFSVDDCLFCQAAMHARQDLKDEYGDCPFLRLCQICMYGRSYTHCGTEVDKKNNVISRARDRLAEVGIYVNPGGIE